MSTLNIYKFVELRKQSFSATEDGILKVIRLHKLYEDNSVTFGDFSAKIVRKEFHAYALNNLRKAIIKP